MTTIIASNVLEKYPEIISVSWLHRLKWWFDYEERPEPTYHALIQIMYHEAGIVRPGDWLQIGEDNYRAVQSHGQFALIRSIKPVKDLNLADNKSFTIIGNTFAE